MSDGSSLSQLDYKALADFRYQIRRFFAFSKGAAEQAGLPPQQYQALLVVKACGDQGVSLTDLSNQLFIRLHSAVELSTRLEKAGFATRVRSSGDRRRMLLHMTEKGERVLEELATVHRVQLGEQAAELIRLLSRMVEE